MFNIPFNHLFVQLGEHVIFVFFGQPVHFVLITDGAAQQRWLNSHSRARHFAKSVFVAVSSRLASARLVYTSITYRETGVG